MLLWQICHTLAFVFAISFQCVPVSAVWTLDKNAKCISSSAMVIAGAALSITEDLVIIALPISELLKLNLSLRKRIALMLVFALGSLYVHLLYFVVLFTIGEQVANDILV